MSKSRRSDADIRAAILRIQDDALLSLEQLSDTLKVSIAGLPTHVSALTLHRWATEGRLGANGQRYWLDVINRRGKWISSSAAVQRFLAAIAEQPGEVIADVSRAG